MAPPPLRLPPLIPESASFDENQYNATFNENVRNILDSTSESKAESSRDAPVPVHQSTAIQAEQNFERQIQKQNVQNRTNDKQNLSAGQQVDSIIDQVNATESAKTTKNKAAGPSRHSTPVKQSFEADRPTASSISGNNRRRTSEFEIPSTKTTGLVSNAEKSNQNGAESQATATSQHRRLQSTPAKETFPPESLSASTIPGKDHLYESQFLSFYSS